MSETYPRVAFFPDAYHEVDGVANTARHFVQYARRHELPMLAVYGGYSNERQTDGPVTTVGFRRGGPSFPLDEKHDFDLWFWRHFNAANAAVAEFKPDLIHITGPSDVGLLGAALAHKHGIPLVASWHTNLHEYAARRAESLLGWLSAERRSIALEKIEDASLRLLMLFYRLAQLSFAPNPELIQLLEQGTGKPCLHMGRGVNLKLFNPDRRDRICGPFTFGYVGRITVEKNVHLLPRLEQALLDAGHRKFRFLIVGQGAAQQWLREHLRQAEFTGVLRGEDLATAYANMDAFVFPSETDTFGNVVLEALASGVPAVVMNAGGPRFVVQHGVTGFTAEDESTFAQHMSRLLTDTELCRTMGSAARNYALTTSWDSVFDLVYSGYRGILAGQSPSLISVPARTAVGDEGPLTRNVLERI